MTTAPWKVLAVGISPAAAAGALVMLATDWAWSQLGNRVDALDHRTTRRN
jgi:hypothetical protein